MKLSTNTLIIGYPHISSDFLMVIKRGGFLQLGRPKKDWLPWASLGLEWHSPRWTQGLASPWLAAKVGLSKKHGCLQMFRLNEHILILVIQWSSECLIIKTNPGSSRFLWFWWVGPNGAPTSKSPVGRKERLGATTFKKTILDHEHQTAS